MALPNSKGKVKQVASSQKKEKRLNAKAKGKRVMDESARKVPKKKQNSSISINDEEVRSNHSILNDIQEFDSSESDEAERLENPNIIEKPDDNENEVEDEGHWWSDTSDSCRDWSKVTEEMKIMRRKALGKRAEVWDHFKPWYCTKDKKNKATCRYCKRALAANSAVHGISSLITHHKNCKLKPDEVETKQQRLSFQPPRGSRTGGLLNWQFEQESVTYGFCKMIIIDEMPFKTVEKRGFQIFMAESCPMWKIPTRKTLSKNIMAMYLRERNKLMAFIKANAQRVSITTDTWTSIQRVNYIVITVHFIDDSWTLNKRIINFVTIASHKGEAIGVDVEKCLVDWGIDKLNTVTVDNASSNDGAVGYLKQRYTARRNGTMLEGENIHIRCVAHIINLIVQDGLKSTEEMNCISRIRNAIRYVRSSPSRFKKFKNVVERQGLQSKRLVCLDVPTRWNSTYLMLDTAISLKEAFSAYEYVETDILLIDGGVPIALDWERATNFMLFLKPFYILTNRVSGTLYVTSNTVFKEICAIHTLIDKYARGKVGAQLTLMAEAMREKFDKYWGDTLKMNKTLYYAVLLDPRSKWTYLNYALNAMYSKDLMKPPPQKVTDLTSSIREGFESLFDEYKRVYGSSTTSTQSQSHGTSSTSTSVDDFSLPDVGQQAYDSVQLGYEALLSQINAQEKSELERYLAEEVTRSKDEHFDILGWWKRESHRYPIISKMARDILAVPVSTVASEAAFSTGGRVLDAFRSSLSIKMVQALICAQDWLREDYVPLNVEENLYEVEKWDEEFNELGKDVSVLDL